MIFALGYSFTIAVAGWLTLGGLFGPNAGRETRPIALFGSLIGLWAVGDLMALFADSSAEMILARRTFFLAAAGLPPTWLWLSVRAANPSWFVRSPWLIAIPFLPSAFFYSCLYWDQSMRFVAWDSPLPPGGPLFDQFAFYQCAISLIAPAFFAQSLKRLGTSRVRVLPALAAGVAIPMAFNLAFILGRVQHDYTTLSLGPATLLIWFAVIESGLSSHLPINRDDVIEQLDVGVIIADINGRIVSVNAAAERLAAMAGLRGRLLPEAVAAAEQRSDAAIESRGLAIHGRFGVIGHALIMNDRTEAETARRRLELGGRLEALGSLTAGIAHEVNNPLAFIQANLSALESTAKKLARPPVLADLGPELESEIEDMAALVEETQEGVERIRTLVQRLKNFSRTPDLGATAVEVDLEHAIRQAAAVATIGQNGEPPRITGPSGLRILSIETAVFQVLVNLLLNAYQAAPDAPAVAVEMKPSAGGVLIRVTDSGPGISPALLPRIFDPFFTTKPTGTGLGLSLSYDLSRQLGGHLSASNSEGGGAAFELWLPSVPPASSPAAYGARDVPEEQSPNAGSTTPPTTPLTTPTPNTPKAAPERLPVA